MKVLLSNDDGIGSEGLTILERFLQRDHQVWVVAPEQERSGMSHAITLREAVRFEEVGERRYACNGTPADCVLYTLLGALPVNPDVVVSGINHGPNLGTDIIYSGTVAAARQASLMGLPGVAVSLVDEQIPQHFSQAASFVHKNLALFAELWRPNYFFNINVPNTPGKTKKTEITYPSRREYQDRLIEHAAPSGHRYFFLDGEINQDDEEIGSDWDAISRNTISISSIYAHPTDRQEDSEDRLRSAKWRRGFE